MRVELITITYMHVVIEMLYIYDRPAVQFLSELP